MDWMVVMDKKEALEILHEYALSAVYDIMWGEAAKKTELVIEEAHEILKKELDNSIVEAEEDSDTLEELVHIYGSKENILNIRPLTEEEYYEIQRKKVLTYLSWENEKPENQERRQKELKWIEDRLESLRNEK